TRRSSDLWMTGSWASRSSQARRRAWPTAPMRLWRGETPSSRSASRTGRATRGTTEDPSMTALIASTGDDPVDLATRLRRAFAGGPAIGLGMLGDAGDELAQVPQGTAVVIATSGSTGVPKQVVLGAEAL